MVFVVTRTRVVKESAHLHLDLVESGEQEWHVSGIQYIPGEDSVDRRFRLQRWYCCVVESRDCEAVETHEEHCDIQPNKQPLKPNMYRENPNKQPALAGAQFSLVRVTSSTQILSTPP